MHWVELLQPFTGASLDKGQRIRNNNKKSHLLLEKTNKRVDWFLYSAVHISILSYEHNLSRLLSQAP